MEAMLFAELKRLGKSASAMEPLLPSGADNQIIFLSADRLPYFEFAEAGAGVRLQWAEKLTGDYDQNGLVSISDLTALGQFFQQRCYYNNHLYGDAVPQGWPGQDFLPIEEPGVELDQLSNWRRARVDGDGNGVVNITDITALAAHWGESLSGYNVYRREGTEGNWQQLFHPEFGDATVSIRRSMLGPSGSNKTGGAFTYEFVDSDAPEGELFYRIAPVLDAAGEGEQSHCVPIWYSAEPRDPTGGILQSQRRHWPSGEEVLFDYAAPEVGLVDVALDFDANGGYDSIAEEATGQLAHGYSDEGQRIAFMRIRLADGRMGHHFVWLRVRSNANPQLEASVSLSDEFVPCRLLINVTRASDPENDPLSYELFLDGEPVSMPASGPETSGYALMQPGLRAVSLLLYDAYGGSDRADFFVSPEVGGERSPDWDFRNVAEGYERTPIPLSATTINGSPAVLFSPFHGTGSEELFFVRSVDAAGESWPAASGIVAELLSGAYIKGDLHEIAKRPAVLLGGIGLQSGTTTYLRALNGNGTLWPEAQQIDIELNPSGVIGLSQRDNLPLVLNAGIGLQAYIGTDADGSAWQLHGEGDAFGYFNSSVLLGTQTAVLQGPLHYVLLPDDPASQEWLHHPLLAEGQNPEGLNFLSGRLAVLDGGPAAAFCTDSAIWFAAALDATGSQWQQPRVIASALDPASMDLASVGGMPHLVWFDNYSFDLRHISAQDSLGLTWSEVSAVDSIGSTGHGCELLEAEGKAAVFYGIPAGGELCFARMK